MITIWKYLVEPDDVNQVYGMPAGALILSFGLDGNDQLCFWAKVNDAAQLEDHVVACVGTGWELDHVFGAKDRYACFIGSVTHGSYVWHLIDLGAGSISEDINLHPPAPDSEVGA